MTAVGPTVDRDEEAGAADWSLGERTQCVFLWVTGEDEAKVLACDARVVLEDGEVVRERAAASLRPDDRVILGLGTRRWSPADEFTESLVEAVRRSRPALVNAAKEWRRALRRLQEAQHKSLWRLRAELAVAGLVRTENTIEGWLNVERAAPIAPRSLRGEPQHCGRLSPTMRSSPWTRSCQRAVVCVLFVPLQVTGSSSFGRGGPLTSALTRRGSRKSWIVFGKRFTCTRLRLSPWERFPLRCWDGGYRGPSQRDSSWSPRLNRLLPAMAKGRMTPGVHDGEKSVGPWRTFSGERRPDRRLGTVGAGCPIPRSAEQPNPSARVTASDVDRALHCAAPSPPNRRRCGLS